MQNKIDLVKEKIINASQTFKVIPKERIIVGAALVLFISFLFYQSIIVVQIRRLKALDFQFNSQRRLLDFYNQLVTNRSDLIEEKKENEKMLSRMKENFVPEEELSSYFDNFRAMVKSANIEVVALDFKPQENPGEFNGRQFSYFQILPLSVSLRGDYFSMMSLLYKLENGKSLFDIKSIRISEDALGTESVTMDIQACIYIFKKG